MPTNETVAEQFNRLFSEDNLKEIFTEHVAYSSATGIDNINQQAFRKQLDDQISIVSRKVLNGTYKFSKYKLKLISKGRKKQPREISIPTIRDRIALRGLCDFLHERFDTTSSFRLPQDIVRDIKFVLSTNRYNRYIKLDISNFYPTINHNTLHSNIRKRVKNDSIIALIDSAISTPTVSTSSKSNDIPENSGVPQGLSISNVLATIYLRNIDAFMAGIPNATCYRYVDDVLILCNQADENEISAQIIKKFKKIGLTVHCPIEKPEKSKIDAIRNGVDYLGYRFYGKKITARQGSVEKLKSSLVGIFSSYKHSKNKSEQVLEWRLNLRITGCIFENKCKGWLFFFSEINDDTLLYQLDHYIAKLCSRFDVHIKPKRFARAHKEIIHRKHESKYLQNFDQFELEDMKETLINYFSFELSTLSDEEIKYHFKRKIGAQVKELEVDIKDFGY